jgi:5'-nucleotidase
LGEVFVVAPAVQKSGVGRSISIMEPIRISEVSINGMKVFAVDGTPTDSVILGIHEIVGEIPDLTVCGINLGENLSSEAATTSGTVCAALEAATQGSKAIAISLEMPDISKFDLTCNQDFSYAKKVLRWLARKVISFGLPDGVDLLNVNVPSKPTGKIEITRLAKRMYSVRIEKRIDPRGREYFWINGIEVDDADEGTDIHALRRGSISITPLTLDLTADVDVGFLRGWFDDWDEGKD